MVSQVDVDGGDEFADAGEAAVANDSVGQLAEEAFDKIHPRGTGRGKVNVDARIFFDPRDDDGVLVGGVVVDDEVEGQLRRRLTVEFLKEGEPFDMRVLRCGRAQDLPVEVVQGGKQRDRAVADVVVGAGADMAQAQGQTRLRPFQCLTLALLVAAQHQRPVRRIEIKTDDIPGLRLEIRIAGQFERPGSGAA